MYRPSRKDVYTGWRTISEANKRRIGITRGKKTKHIVFQRFKKRTKYNTGIVTIKYGTILQMPETGKSHAPLSDKA